MASQIAAPFKVENWRHRAFLESKLKGLLDTSRDHEGLCIEHEADPGDQGKSQNDRDLAALKLDKQSRVVHDVCAALAKMDNGSYGQCERCKGPIAPRRLDAIPWAQLCLACQSAAEAELDFPEAAPGWGDDSAGL
jgi:DnaK suppressor protein